MALVFVIYSYIGTEVIAVAAGETRDPAKTVPRAVRSMVARLIALYVGSMVVLVGIALLTLNSAFAEEGIRPHTRDDLKTAMQREALSVLKYTAFAQHARREGKIALAELLEQTARSEQRHFSELARMDGLVREDWHNLANAIVSEYAEFSQTYTRMAERAEAAGDKDVAKTFREIAAEEAKHHQDFQAAVSKSLKPD